MSKKQKIKYSQKKANAKEKLSDSIGNCVVFMVCAEDKEKKEEK